MSLTDVVLRALKPKGASYIVSDDRGLCVEVLARVQSLYRKQQEKAAGAESATVPQAERRSFGNLGRQLWLFDASSNFVQSSHIRSGNGSLSACQER
jgi:hypothetical protein